MFIIKTALVISLAASAAQAQVNIGAIPSVAATVDPSLAGAFNVPGPQAIPMPVTPVKVGLETLATPYFPIDRVLRLEYEHASSEFIGTRTIILEFTSYSASDNSVGVRKTSIGRTSARSVEYVVNVYPGGVMAGNSPLGGARLELPLPVVPGSSWQEGPDQSRVAALGARVAVPAGSFADCVRVVTRLAGGEAGVAERYYAPGVGLVYETRRGEDFQETLKLVSYLVR